MSWKVRYEAARAQRQYDAIDPDNRLVAGELERRWNQRLVAVHNLEVQIVMRDLAFGAAAEPSITEYALRAFLMTPHPTMPIS